MKNLSLSVLVEEALKGGGSVRAQELVQRVISKDSSCSEDEVLECLASLGGNGRVTFHPPRFSSFGSFFTKVHWNTDFWVVLGLVTFYVTLQILPIGFPWTLLLIPPGILLMFYFPGHGLLKIFLRNLTLSSVEQYVLEIGTSFSIVMIAGLLLNLAVAGFDLKYLIPTVAGLDLLLALTGSYTDYEKSRRRLD